MTSKEWQAILDPRTTWETVMDVVMARYAQLGLTYPSEKTALMTWVMFLVARVAPNHPALGDMAGAVQHKLEFMATAKAFRERIVTPPVGAGRVLRYPSHVDLFKAENPDIAAVAFAESLREMQSQVDERSMFEVFHGLPCRGSHSGVKQSRSKRWQHRGEFKQAWGAPGSSRSSAWDSFNLHMFDKPQVASAAIPGVGDYSPPLADKPAGALPQATSGASAAVPGGAPRFLPAKQDGLLTRAAASER